jgi:hypothetical protein
LGQPSIGIFFGRDLTGATVNTPVIALSQGLVRKHSERALGVSLIDQTGI